MINTYSRGWFELFVEPISSDQSESEAAFVARNLPLPRFRSVVDLCCGTGRHAGYLTAAGYRITGIDADERALRQARTHVAHSDARFLALDMRQVSQLSESFDAFICLWQSFGYFDDETNMGVVGQIQDRLSPGGRLILDIYHRAFFERHEGARSFTRKGISVTEHKHMTGERLRVKLEYDGRDEADKFDWRLYNPDELADELEVLGFRCILTCTEFDERRPATSDRPRMQLVFESVR